MEPARITMAELEAVIGDAVRLDCSGCEHLGHGERDHVCRHPKIADCDFVVSVKELWRPIWCPLGDFKGLRGGL